MKEGQRNPFFSKRIQGAVIMFLSLMATAFGLDFDEGQATEAIAELSLFLGWAWNLYGSVVAKQPLLKNNV